MNTPLKKWLPVALCCLPCLLIVAGIGISLVFGGTVASQWGTAVLRWIAVLACPVAMGLMMWWMSQEQGDHRTNQAQTPAERLAALRQQRQALDMEIAELTQWVEREAQQETRLNNAEANQPVITHP